MSIFDPQTFLDAQITEVNERRPPLPVENPASADGLYTAIIGEIKATSGNKDGKPWMSMVVPLKIDVPGQLQQELKLKPILTLTDRAFIDLTPDGTSIDNSPGANRAQKNYREATGNNEPGKAFAWRMLEGQVVKVRLTHELYQEQIQERVAGVFKA